MIEIIRERTLDVPVNRVWDLIERVERLPQWFAATETAVPLEGQGLGRKQRVPGAGGPIALKSTKPLPITSPGECSRGAMMPSDWTAGRRRRSLARQSFGYSFRH